MLMGGLFGRSVGALCHAIDVTESLSGEFIFADNANCHVLEAGSLSRWLCHANASGVSSCGELRFVRRRLCSGW